MVIVTFSAIVRSFRGYVVEVITRIFFLFPTLFDALRVKKKHHESVFDLPRLLF